MPVEKKLQDLLDMEEPQTQPPPKKEQSNGGGDLLDLGGEPEKPYATTQEYNNESTSSNVYSTQLNKNKEDINFFEDNRQAS